MNIQDKLQEIHHKYGTTEMANYKIQLYIDELIEEEKKNTQTHLSVIEDIKNIAFGKGSTQERMVEIKELLNKDNK